MGEVENGLFRQKAVYHLEHKDRVYMEKLLCCQGMEVLESWSEGDETRPGSCGKCGGTVGELSHGKGMEVVD